VKKELQQMLIQQRKWPENVKPIVTQYALKDIFNTDETALFYNAQLKRIRKLKEQNCQEGNRYKERVTVLLCCNADGSKKLHPLIVGKFKKPHCLKWLKYYPCDYKSSKNVWVTGRLFRQWLVSFKRKMACQIRNVLLLMDHCVAHYNKGLIQKHAPLVPTAKHHQLHATTRPGHQILHEMRVLKESSAFSVARNRQECTHRRHKKMEHAGCHVK
jgi:hypothetical protein